MKQRRYKRAVFGLAIFLAGLLLASVMFSFAHPGSDLKTYVDVLSVPVLVSFAFAGASVVVDAYIEENK